MLMQSRRRAGEVNFHFTTYTATAQFQAVSRSISHSNRQKECKLRETPSLQKKDLSTPTRSTQLGAGLHVRSCLGVGLLGLFNIDSSTVLSTCSRLDAVWSKVHSFQGPAVMLQGCRFHGVNDQCVHSYTP